jgi:hypothetical protein
MLPRRRLLQGLAAAPLLGLEAIATVAPAAADGPGLHRWRAADAGFADWALDGARLEADGRLAIEPATARRERDPYPPGGYFGRSYYTGGEFLVGDATSPVMPAAPFREAIASWEADTPPGTWLEVRLRLRLGERWTDAYSLGVWAVDDATVARHSVTPQGDADARVAVDTLVLREAVPAADAFQLQLRLFAVGPDIGPSARGVTVATSGSPGRPAALTPGDPRHWDRVIDLPACSQMVYPDGGRAWCSPTSVAMALSYWAGAAGDECEDRVRATVAGVYDWRYRGHGNWPFNTAHAATHGWDAYVARLPGLAAAEPWTAAGVPLIVSVAWGPGELAGAPLAAVDGHLLVLAGFDAAGDPVVHDPAASTDAGVRRVYRRAEFEPLWLAHSGGTAYIIHPPDWPGPGVAPPSDDSGPRPE